MTSSRTKHAQVEDVAEDDTSSEEDEQEEQEEEGRTADDDHETHEGGRKDRWEPGWQEQWQGKDTAWQETCMCQ